MTGRKNEEVRQERKRIFVKKEGGSRVILLFLNKEHLYATPQKRFYEGIEQKLLKIRRQVFGDQLKERETYQEAGHDTPILEDNLLFRNQGLFND